jgi:hypothetical protein
MFINQAFSRQNVNLRRSRSSRTFRLYVGNTYIVLVLPRSVQSKFQLAVSPELAKVHLLVPLEQCYDDDVLE